jgi:KaiC/GvpD/RAD55 family RecA-like ATPase
LSRVGNNLNEAQNLGKSSSSNPQIPGIYLPIHNAGLKLLLLYGPPGAGKTMYCRQFLIEGMLRGDTCIFISTGLSKMQFNALFSSIENAKVPNVIEFINPSDYVSTYSSDKVIPRRKLATAMLSNLMRHLETRLVASDKKVTSPNQKNSDDESTTKPVRLVIDSLTHTQLLLGERLLMECIMNLIHSLKNYNITAILTVTASSIEDKLVTNLGSIVDSILEMRVKEDSYGVAIRSVRVRHIKGVHYDPKWTNFKISNNGAIMFRGAQYSSLRSPTEITCTLCAKPIIGTPLIQSDFLFDSKECMEIYNRLETAYGSKISETGLPSQAFDTSFFFIDIVGLSDPTMSVKKQVQKIEVMNKLILSCDSFRRGSTGKKIILPAGDGMAIGFLSNPEIPLELSIQLHHKLRSYNEDRDAEDAIGVRIGLGSGPVFTVTDLNNVQNIWGPGIILARRVMDAGDNGHILIAEKLAEELIPLKDEYRRVIKLISNKYTIKHGQNIKLYSAYSDDFGNPDIPTKVPQPE